MSLALALSVVVSLICPGRVAHGSENEWRVGLASARITPDKPVEMAGYAKRKEPFTSVMNDLYAKAMAFEDKEGNRALLITAEVLGFPNELSERICRQIESRTGLPRECVMLNGTHSHTGPLVRTGPGLPVSDEAKKRVEDYTDHLIETIVNLTPRAFADLQPARLSWGNGIAKFVTNRREHTERWIILGHNPRGLADRTVPVLRIDGRDGKLRAVLFGAACHNTTLTQDHTDIDGDYAGYARSELEQRFPGVQAMFMIGCAGDANPYPRGTVELARQHGIELATEVARVLEMQLKAINGPLRVAFERVDLPLQRFSSREEIMQVGEQERSFRKFFVQGALRHLEEKGPLPEAYNAPFAMWQFGDDLTLVGFSGETLVDYVSFTERDLGPLDLWIAGYCNDLFGYLPSARVLAEGGYETRGIYTGVGLFAPEVENVVMETIKRMAEQVGRPMPAGKGAE
jgi:neutral ceramidase